MVRLPFIPKEHKFFDLFEESAQNTVKAAQALKEMVDNWQFVDSLVAEITEMEHRGDTITHQVISLLHRNGEIYEEKLNDKDEAIETYKQVLTLSPAYLPALQSLGRLYFIKGMWEDLIDMFRQEIGVTRNESQQIILLYKIGELYEEKMVQEDNAIAAYREVLAIQQDNFPARKARIRIYNNTRDG